MIRLYYYEKYDHCSSIAGTLPSLVSLSRHYFLLVYSDFVISLRFEKDLYEWH